MLRTDLLQPADDDPVARVEPLVMTRRPSSCKAPVVTRRYWTLLSASTT